jgi:deazaflavin-dependent oxidoreductase (nitroreductase family)
MRWRQSARRETGEIRGEIMRKTENRALTATGLQRLAAIGRFAGAMALVAFTLITTVSLIVRFQPRRVINRLRRFNRRYFNKLILTFAGQAGQPFTVVRHVGRRSGQPYETPVYADPIANGFVIPLTYGPEVDWLRNVQASGTATIVRNGVEYPVGDSEVIDSATAFALMSRGRARFLGLLGYRAFARVQNLSIIVAEASPVE